MNFNPFKKNKEDKEYRLNEESLPSLNSGGNNLSSIPSIDDESHDTENNLPIAPQFQGSNPSSQTFGNGGHNLGGNNNSSFDNDDIEDGLESGSSTGNIKSWDNPNSQNNSQSNSNNDENHQLNRSKLDTIEAKVTLIDARMYAMEQKIELMFQMISNEISEETKRKYKVNTMMQNIKNNK